MQHQRTHRSGGMKIEPVVRKWLKTELDFSGNDYCLKIEADVSLFVWVKKSGGCIASSSVLITRNRDGNFYRKIFYSTTETFMSGSLKTWMVIDDKELLWCYAVMTGLVYNINFEQMLFFTLGKSGRECSRKFVNFQNPEKFIESKLSKFFL